MEKPPEENPGPPGPTESIRAGYDRWAAVYDHDLNPLPALEEPVVRRLVGDPQGLKVVDLGCGTGRHTLWLARSGAIVTAVDFSSAMLAEARAKPGAETVRFLSHDLATPLPLPSGEFDLAVSGLVLEHLRDLRGFFREMRRVVRDRGRAVISAMHPSMFLRGSRARFTDPASGKIVEPGSYSHTLSDFLMAALAAGFRLARMEEHAPDAGFAQRYPRAEKYIGWPMLVVLELDAADRPC